MALSKADKVFTRLPHLLNKEREEHGQTQKQLEIRTNQLDSADKSIEALNTREYNTQAELTSAKSRMGLLESLASSTDEELLVEARALREEKQILKDELLKSRTHVHSLVAESEANRKSTDNRYNEVNQQLTTMTQKYTKMGDDFNELGQIYNKNVQTHEQTQSELRNCQERNIKLLEASKIAHEENRDLIQTLTKKIDYLNHEQSQVRAKCSALELKYSTSEVDFGASEVTCKETAESLQRAQSDLTECSKLKTELTEENRNLVETKKDLATKYNNLLQTQNEKALKIQESTRQLEAEKIKSQAQKEHINAMTRGIERLSDKWGPRTVPHNASPLQQNSRGTAPCGTSLGEEGQGQALPALKRPREDPIIDTSTRRAVGSSVKRAKIAEVPKQLCS